tara:strand:- start:579 stop:3302 length:2724 start_codon:yes stop_codon:yes gene_type:complete
MNRILYLVIVIIVCNIKLNAQLVCSNDTIICSNSPITIETQIANIANLNLVTGSCFGSPGLSDDQYSAAINIGFNFDFYGQTYSQLLISSNNYVTFDLTNTSGYSPWAINNAIPNAGNPVNSIMSPWQDINPCAVYPPTGAYGLVEYGLTGSSPNQIFIVRWIQIPMFGCTDSLFCSSVFLYEGSNKIETHIEYKSQCNTWNQGAAIHGVQNAQGNIADVVPGRNFPTVWGAQNDGYEFVPNGPNAYTINPIPYQPVLTTNTVTWTDGTGNIVGNGTSIIVNPTTTTTYTATSTGCSVSGSLSCNTTVTVSSLNINQSTNDVSCNSFSDGSATVSLSGSGAPWDVVWQNASGITIQTDNGVNNNATCGNLSAGNYTAIITDASGCVVQEPIIITEPQTLTLSSVVNNISCYNAGDGSIDISFAGGTATHSFSWTGSNGFTALTKDISGLEPGTYTVTCTDGNGCTETLQETISEPAELIVSLTSYADVTCNGFSDGYINIGVSGGTPPYLYNWTATNSFTGNTQNVSNLDEGNYTVTITDDNGCTNSLSQEIIEAGIMNIAAITSSFNGFEISCYGFSDGIIDLTTSNGTPPYIYSWSGPNNFMSSQEDISGLSTGDYIVSVTDQNNCTSQSTISLFSPTPLNIVPANLSDVSCNYTNDGFIDISVWGGISNNNTYSYNWTGPNNFFSNQQDIFNLEDAGDYTIIVVDNNNCSSTFSYYLNKPDILQAVIYTLSDTLSINYPVIDFYDHSIGNPTSWKWTINDGSPITYTQDKLDHLFPSKGIYNVQLAIEDINNCKDSTTKIILVKDEHTFYIPNSFTPDNDGHNDQLCVKYHALREDTYQIKIFNRFGQMIFESNDPNECWDGKYKNKKAPHGVYSYYISYQDFEGWIRDYTNRTNCSGTISLIR